MIAGRERCVRSNRVSLFTSIFLNEIEKAKRTECFIILTAPFLDDESDGGASRVSQEEVGQAVVGCGR